MWSMHANTLRGAVVVYVFVWILFFLAGGLGESQAFLQSGGGDCSRQETVGSDLAALTSPLAETESVRGLKYFILDNFTTSARGISHGFSPDCMFPAGRDGPPGAAQYKVLYERPDRTEDMGEAKVFFAGTRVMFRKSCKLKFTSEIFAHLSVEPRYVKTMVSIFHDLKRERKIAQDARLFLFYIYAYDKTANRTAEGDMYNDVSFYSPDGLTGGMQPGFRTPFDITIDQSRDVFARTPWPRHNLTTCDQYTNLVFFTGRFTQRQQYGMTPPPFWTPAPGDGPLDLRVPNIRKKVVTALDTELAREHKVVVRGGTRPKEKSLRFYSQELFNNYMEHSTFCLHMAGESSFSMRFYVALRYGCIPLVVSGGWLLPFSPVIQWDKLVVRVSEAFNFSDVTGFVAEVQRQRDEKLRLHWGGDICRWHRAVWELGHSHFGLDMQYGLLVRSAKIVWATTSGRRSNGNDTVGRLGHDGSS